MKRQMHSMTGSGKHSAVRQLPEAQLSLSETLLLFDTYTARIAVFAAVRVLFLIKCAAPFTVL